MPLHVLIESECRWQAGRQAGRQPVRTMCFPNCTGVRFSLLGVQSAPSTTKGAMPSKVQWQCPSRKTEMKTNLGCLSRSPLLVGWAFHSVSLSICVCQSSIQYLSIYLSSQLLPTTSSLGTVASLLGARREWREAYLIVCPIKLPQFEASMSIATSEERMGGEGSGRLVRSRMRRRNFALCRVADLSVRRRRPPFQLHICMACKHMDIVYRGPRPPLLDLRHLRGRFLASYTDCCTCNF